jgi:uroporphyrinogen decarboxylase
VAGALSSQERVRTAIDRKVPDRVPIHDGPWMATVRRWRKEGLPEGVSPADYFGYEISSISADLTPRFPTRVLSEDEEYIVETTPMGGIRRNHKDYSTTPEVVETPIKKKDDWPAIRERLGYDFKRVDWASSWKKYQRAREKGRYVVFANASGYDLLQSYVKSEQLLVFMAEDPAFVKEMADTTSDLILETVLNMLAEGFTFDGVWVFNDMGYRNSTLFSPQMYRDIIAPSDKKRNDHFHEEGMQTILHSCGCVKGLVADLIEAGFDCLQPLEVKAGMDLRELKPRFGGDIALFGGINTMLMEDPDDSKIEEEIRDKMTLAKRGGGYLFHSDHSIPNDVSFARYRFVMDCVKRYGAYP